MCSPEIMKAVNDKVKQEKEAGVSRRNFLKIGGLTAAGLAIPASLSAPPRLLQQEMTGEVLDLSHVLSESVPTYTNLQPTRETIVTVENDGFYVQVWSFGEHSGTHMDAPAHFDPEGTTVDNLPAGMFVAPIVVVDVSERVADNADTMVTVDDLTAWEADNGEIPAGALVCMYSGWESRWNDAEAFRNVGDDGLQHYPGFGAEAADYLLTERDITGIGVDTLSLDVGASTTFDVHLSVLPAGKYGLEGLANLGELISKQATAVVGVPRYMEGSGGPCRVLAML